METRTADARSRWLVVVSLISRERRFVHPAGCLWGLVQMRSTSELSTGV